MNLTRAETGDLLDELEARNKEQKARHHNNEETTKELIRKLRLAFSVRPGGLTYSMEDA
jgi:hypothetical protein